MPTLQEVSWCSLCGATTPDQTTECDVCRQWWIDNPPPVEGEGRKCEPPRAADHQELTGAKDVIGCQQCDGSGWIRIAMSAQHDTAVHPAPVTVHPCSWCNPFGDTMRQALRRSVTVVQTGKTQRGDGDALKRMPRGAVVDHAVAARTVVDHGNEAEMACGHDNVERIIAAAVRVRGVTMSMPPPARHYHIVNSLCDTLGIPDSTRYAAPDDQGFITDRARFVGREEAKTIALQAGQLTPSASIHMRELYSEDL